MIKLEINLPEIIRNHKQDWMNEMKTRENVDINFQLSVVQPTKKSLQSFKSRYTVKPDLIINIAYEYKPNTSSNKKKITWSNNSYRNITACEQVCNKWKSWPIRDYYNHSSLTGQRPRYQQSTIEEAVAGSPLLSLLSPLHSEFFQPQAEKL